MTVGADGAMPRTDGKPFDFRGASRLGSAYVKRLRAAGQGPGGAFSDLASLQPLYTVPSPNRTDEHDMFDGAGVCRAPKRHRTLPRAQ